MRFLMFVCTDTVPVEPPATAVPDVDDWVNAMDGRGARIAGDAVAHERESRTVRVRGGKTLVTDGPFLETKEVLAGFDLLDCADMDEAIEIASGHPMAYRGVIELRPIREL